LQPIQSPGVPLGLLFVDNAQTDYALLVRYIERDGYTLRSARVETAMQLREALCGAAWDGVISELDLPGFPLGEVLSVLRESAPDTPCIVVTGSGDEDAAVEALVAGADDYVSKSRLMRLLPALKRSIAAATARGLERVEYAKLRRLQPQTGPAPAGNAAAGDGSDAFARAMAELAAGLVWFADNLESDAARVRVRHMQSALDRARRARGRH
jgi:DNA-binding NtrC family response regulator